MGIDISEKTFEFDSVGFGQRLWTLRQGRGLSVRELARELGCSKACVWQWEYGRRSPHAEYLCRMSKFFNVSIDYLCFGREYESPWVKVKVDD